jgi:two-component system, cell cycle sensor histidine kinase and response regulator CckA
MRVRGQRYLSDLRRRAELVLVRRPLAKTMVNDVQRMASELAEHRMEHELQNEQLSALQVELETVVSDYRDLYDYAPVGYLTLDTDARVRGANARALELLGVTARELLGEPLVCFMSEPDAGRFGRAHADPRLARAGLEVMFERRDATRFPALVESVPFATHDARWYRTAIVDLTELRSAEAELREREARLAAIFDAAPDAILLVDHADRIESLNRAGAALFGCDTKRMLQAHVRRLIPGFEQSDGGGGDGPRELLGRREDGSSFPLELTTSRYSAGQHSRAVLFVRDVSERRQRGAELRESLLRFHQIADRIEDVFYVAERESLLYVSPAFERIFAAALPERIWRDAVHPDDRAQFDQALRLLETGEACDLEYRIVRPDGSERLLHHRAFLVEHAGRSTGILTDVTEERALERSLRQAQRMETLGMLASGIAHDFNNLLMGIIGCARMALEQLDERSPAHAHVRRGLDAALRGTNISKQLLAFGRTQPVSRKPVALDAVVSCAHELVERLVEPNVEVRLELAASGARILADAGDIEQILLNLATNARDAMSGSGTLTLRTERRRSAATEACEVALSVSDTGIGMDQRTSARVFEPFFTTKPPGAGTGLGLPSVAALVRRLGGTITLDTRLGQGTTFTLVFPVAPPPAEPVSESIRPPVSSGDTVLVIEPDALVLMTLRHYLESLGYRALLCENQEQALEQLSRDDKVGVLLVNVGSRRGLSTRRALALRERNGNPRMLYMSARPSRALARLAGDGHVLYKPFDEATLAQALVRVLARSEPPFRPSVLLVEDSEAARLTMSEYLESRGFDVLASADARGAMALAERSRVDVLVTDYVLPDATGTALALELRGRLPELPVLLVSGSADVLAPSDARFLQKPFELTRLEHELEEMLQG